MMEKFIRYKKRAAITVFVVFTTIAAVHIIHALTLDRKMEYKEIVFSSYQWPQQLTGYRIAFVVDIHAMPVEELEAVVQEINNRSVNLLLLGGDFAFYNDHYKRSLEILSSAITADGIFGVEGNHDNHILLFAAKEDLGITPLSNSGTHIHNGFFLAGVEDLWNRNPCIATAISNATADDFVLLITHNPDIAMQQDTTNVNLILAGHTHGGQINFFGLWAPYFTLRGTITGYGQRFSRGWAVSKDNAPVFVSRGTGIHYYHVPNVFARPQVVFLTMQTEL